MEVAGKYNNKLSSSSLKIIAAIIMLIDHIGAVLILKIYYSCEMHGAYLFGNRIYNLYLNGDLGSLYMLFRIIGRISFPIFCYMIVEGFLYSKNIKKYILRMFLFALISEIPYDLAFKSSLFDLEYQNVGFLFLIALIVLSLQKWILNVNIFKDSGMSFLLKWLIFVVILLVGCVTAELINADYGAFGIALIEGFYLGKNNRKLRMILGIIIILIYSLFVNPLEIYSIISFIILANYNGKRGLSLKYFFYIFYPAHLLILYYICVLLRITGFASV